MKDLVAQRAAEQFVGRARELSGLLATLNDDGPLVTHLHGIGGIGKSSLLDAFAACVRERGVTVVSLDCRAIEPTPRGFLRELGLAIGLDPATPEDAADRLGTLGERVVLTLDTYEVFRLMDTWLRQSFVPALTDNVRVVLAGREPPVAAWLSSPGWQGLFRSMTLEPLSEQESVEFLARNGVSGHDAHRINRFTRGHPLALRLAASATDERPDLNLEEAAIQRVVEELTRMYLLDVRDPLTRRALEAASVVRRATLPLLRAMLPETAPQDAWDRLQSLPFVEISRDGLHLHGAVQNAIATNLRTSDPERYQSIRRAAWTCLRTEVRTASTTELWRYTADMLYIIENPVLREAFFPTDSHRFAFEPARPDDGIAIRDIITTTEGPESAGYLIHLWEHAPQVFRVARDRDGSVAGFYCMFNPDDLDDQVMLDDPVLRLWLEHLRGSPAPRGQASLFARRSLSRGRGELPSPVQAAAWLDVKRTYMELRPHLRYVYMTVWDIATYGQTLQQLGFRPIPGGELTLDGVVYYSTVLDFGPQSVDGWLARLVGTELDIEVDDDILDVDARELVLDGKRVPLTKLEFETLRYLHDREGKAVSRNELLDEVWGYNYEGGSNVVDVVVRSLRKKLGSQASAIETVWGSGYRYRRP